MKNQKKLNPHIVPYDPQSDDFINKINCNTRYVSDGIEKDYENWNAKHPIFISAQTGHGKNYFIEEIILNYISKTDKKILIISNRIANNRQQKERIATIVGCQEYLEQYTPKGLDKIECFGNVRIITYQKLGVYLGNFFELKKLRDYSMVIMDEVHFFVNDALFNNETGRILDKSLLIFKNAIRIYMSATPDEILPIIVKSEKALGNTKEDAMSYINFRDKAIVKPRELLLYNFKRDYSYIIPKYFESKEQIIEIIKKDRSETKWLIFVSSKENGQTLVNEIGSNSIFITADSKFSKAHDGEVYDEIVKTEKFSYKVLICTSVMDNGINIKDSLLTNIVIFACDKTEVLQMVGRKRVIDDKKVNLYLCARDGAFFNRKLSTLNKQIQAICCIKSNPSAFSKQYSIGSATNTQLFSGLFYFEHNSIDNNLIIRTNRLTEIKIYNDKKFYENIIDRFILDSKEAFIYEQLSWLGLRNKFDTKSWVNFEENDIHLAKFLKFLSSNCGINFTAEEFNKFAIEFKNLAINAFGNQPNDRSNRTYGETKMRKIFKKYDLDYDIKVKNKIYTLKKCN